eukprot:5341832-Pleurochrysis_carterae.AAC.1
MLRVQRAVNALTLNHPTDNFLQHHATYATLILTWHHALCHASNAMRNTANTTSPRSAEPRR